MERSILPIFRMQYGKFNFGYALSVLDRACPKIKYHPEYGWIFIVKIVISLYFLPDPHLLFLQREKQALSYGTH